MDIVAPRAETPDTGELERHRRELTGYCYRMLGSPFDAEDAVQETMLRAWRASDRFEGRSSVRAWLYRIATNVCLDMLGSRERRVRPMDLGPAREPVASNLRTRDEATWLEPIPDVMVVAPDDPADALVAKDTLRLAILSALQFLPLRQRAALILCEVFRWSATEAAELLEMSVAGINSALQRARATLRERAPSADDPAPPATQSDLLDRYLRAFEAYDMDALRAVIHEDAVQSMPPFDLWLAGRESVFTWWLGPGAACRGSRMIPAPTANGAPAFGQYKPGPDGYEPWALQVLGTRDDQITELTFFLSTARLFPLFGLPERLPA